jgi:hypothetical protein
MRCPMKEPTRTEECVSRADADKQECWALGRSAIHQPILRTRTGSHLNTWPQLIVHLSLHVFFLLESTTSAVAQLEIGGGELNG